MMKCLSTDEIEAYMMTATLSQKQQIADHIATCQLCSSRYDKLIQEQLHWSQELFEEVLPDSFTNMVMTSLEREELELHSSNETRKGLFKRKGIGFWKLAIVAALLLVVMSSVVLYSIPTLEIYPLSIWAEYRR